MGVLPSTKINMKNLREDINGGSTYNVKIRVSDVDQRYDTYMERKRESEEERGAEQGAGKIQYFNLI